MLQDLLNISDFASLPERRLTTIYRMLFPMSPDGVAVDSALSPAFLFETSFDIDPDDLRKGLITHITNVAV
jgi:hypothetical protein